MLTFSHIFYNSEVIGIWQAPEATLFFQALGREESRVRANEAHYLADAIGGN